MAEKQVPEEKAEAGVSEFSKAQKKIVEHLLEGRVLKVHDGRPYFMPRIRGDERFWNRPEARKALDGMIAAGLVVLQAPHLHRGSTGQLMTLSPDIVPQEEEWEDVWEEDGEG